MSKSRIFDDSESGYINEQEYNNASCDVVSESQPSTSYDVTKQSKGKKVPKSDIDKKIKSVQKNISKLSKKTTKNSSIPAFGDEFSQVSHNSITKAPTIESSNSFVDEFNDQEVDSLSANNIEQLINSIISKKLSDKPNKKSKQLPQDYITKKTEDEPIKVVSKKEKISDDEMEVFRNELNFIKKALYATFLSQQAGNKKTQPKKNKKTKKRKTPKVYDESDIVFVSRYGNGYQSNKSSSSRDDTGLSRAESLRRFLSES